MVVQPESPERCTNLLGALVLHVWHFFNFQNAFADSVPKRFLNIFKNTFFFNANQKRNHIEILNYRDLHKTQKKTYNALVLSWTWHMFGTLFGTVFKLISFCPISTRTNGCLKLLKTFFFQCQSEKSSSWNAFILLWLAQNTKTSCYVPYFSLWGHFFVYTFWNRQQIDT